MELKGKGKSIAITSGLVALLALVILVEISLFISGPARKYEADIEEQKAAIQEKYQNIEQLTRHVFQYVVYIGQDDQNVVWFNEEAEAIISKEKSTLQIEKAMQTVKNTYGFEGEVSLGYGYDNPVYVVIYEDYEIMLDYDTLKVVHYMNKGVTQ